MTVHQTLIATCYCYLVVLSLIIGSLTGRLEMRCRNNMMMVVLVMLATLSYWPPIVTADVVSTFCGSMT
jgi:hypothetical protein